MLEISIFAAANRSIMNIKLIIPIFLLGLSISSCTCNGDKINSDDGLQSGKKVIEQPEEKIVDSGTLPGTWEPANYEGIVFHYVCPDRCVGGVLDYEGNCPICGKQLHHNTAYHFNNNNPTQTPAADYAAQQIRNTENDPPQSPNGIWHFMCENGHGSGVEGICPKCGSELIHNDDYHTDTESDEPAQNLNGVWHFICPDGHPGGAGAPLNCDICGKKLQHNEAYHTLTGNTEVGS